MVSGDEREPGGISVVIVDWNEPAVTLEAIESVRMQVVPDRTIEIVVVDNGSTTTAGGHPASAVDGVRVIRLPENTGFTGGANAGIAAAIGDTVILLNNDARLEPGAVDALASALVADERVAAATALIVLADRMAPAETAPDLVAVDGRGWRRDPSGIDLVNSTGGEVTRSGNGRDRDWLAALETLARGAGPAMAFSGGAVALRRSALVDVGGFDEGYFMYYEDTDLSWRLRRRGWSIQFVPEAVVRHRHAHSSGASSEFFARFNERNRLRFVVIHGTGRVVAAAFARTLAGSAIALVRGDGAVAKRRFGTIREVLGDGSNLRRRRRELAASATVGIRDLWRGAPRD